MVEHVNVVGGMDLEVSSAYDLHPDCVQKSDLSDRWLVSSSPTALLECCIIMMVWAIKAKANGTRGLHTFIMSSVRITVGRSLCLIRHQRTNENGDTVRQVNQRHSLESSLRQISIP